MSKINELHTNIEALTTNVDNTLLGYTHIKNTVKNCQENLATQVERLETRLNGNSTESQTMYDKVYTDGYTEGVEDGKQAEYDAFWDRYQNNGKRESYNFAFAGIGWDDVTFDPKYPLEKVTYGMNMFMQSNITVLDKIVLFGDFTRNNMFTSSGLTTINITIPEEAIANAWFNHCKVLKNLNVSGTIGGQGFNFSWSKSLTKESITSVINALSSTSTGLTVTLSVTAVNNAFTTDEWDTLTATKSNWTISLIDS